MHAGDREKITRLLLCTPTQSDPLRISVVQQVFNCDMFRMLAGVMQLPKKLILTKSRRRNLLI